MLDLLWYLKYHCAVYARTYLERGLDSFEFEQLEEGTELESQLPHLEDSRRAIWQTQQKLKAIRKKAKKNTGAATGTRTEAENTRAQAVTQHKTQKRGRQKRMAPRAKHAKLMH